MMKINFECLKIRYPGKKYLELRPVNGPASLNLLTSVMKKIFFLLIPVVGLLISSCKKTEKQEDENAIYTCSMDPQVVEHHPGKCPICHMELTKVSGMPDKNDNTIHISDAQKAVADIKTEFVEIQKLSSERTLPAVVAVDQNSSTTVSSKISGRIELLYYKTLGDQVQKGLPLFQIYSEELMAAEQDYLTALQLQKNDSGAANYYDRLAEAAKQKLILWGMNNDQLFQLARIKIPESVFTVYAEEPGVITEIFVHEGDYMMEGSPVYKLTDLSSLWVEAQLYASEAASVSSMMQAEVSFDALPDKNIKGKISFANPELLSDSKLLIVRIEIKNTDHTLTPGMQAYITVRSNARDALAVPSSAIIQDSHGATVWLKKSPGVYEPRMVETGMENKEYTEIVSGLEEGDAVVTSGAYLLQSEYIFRKGKDPMAGMKM